MKNKTLEFWLLLPLIAILIQAHSPSMMAAVPPKSVTPGPFGSSSRLLSEEAPVSAAATNTNAAMANGFGCGDLRRTALKLSTHASNLANRNTTRTPTGGPYKRLEVVCKAAQGAFCNIEAIEEFRLEKLPGHLDADTAGIVKYPVINVGSESAGLNTAAAELKMLAKGGVCATKIVEQDGLMIVKYNSDFEVMMDTISFAADGRITRWSRTTREGRTQNLAFQNDGTPIGL